MEKFEMVAKTLAGLEEVLAEELRGIGAENVEPGRRMVSFQGDLAMLYKANLCCRTALRVLKPFYKFIAHTPDELYEKAKEFDWGSLLKLDQTFCIDSVVYSDEFSHSQYVTYKIKDAICDWFQDRLGEGKRPGVRLQDADINLNVHISGGNITLSLDSSGESLHKRGYRVAQNEAPINEVLAAGIILLSGWRGDEPFADPMCGSGTFLIEAALIAANINPGIYRQSFAFQNWPDYDADLFEQLYEDDSQERTPYFPIVGADISKVALDISLKNAQSAGVAKYITLQHRAMVNWEEDDVPKPAGVLVTNPPYGHRIKVEDMEGLYETIGNRLKFAFKGYHAWIIGYNDEYFQKIGLAPSQKIDLYNGALECELREYVIFEGDKKSFLASGGKIKNRREDEEGETRNFTKGERRERSRGDFKKDDRKDFKKDARREFKKDDRRGFKKDDRRGFKKDDRREFKRDDRREFKKDDRREFKKDDRREFKKEDRRDFKKSDRFEKRAERRDYRSREAEPQEPESENPLAKRRNPEALKMLQNKQPALPETQGPLMRSRGWRKKS